MKSYTAICLILERKFGKGMNKNKRLLYVLLYLSVFFKQFYFLPSGNLQLGDLFFVAACVTAIGLNFKENHKPLFQTKDKPFYIFVLFVTGINLANYMIYPDKWFLKSTAYFIFISAVVFVYRQCVADNLFVKYFGYVIRFNIILQFAIFMTGRGRYLFEHRYSGTFKDPNQMSFFLFSSFLLLTVITELKKGRQRYNIPILFMVLLLTYYSKSTGITLGIMVFITLYPVLHFLEYRPGKNTGLAGKQILFFVVCFLVIIVGFGMFLWCYNLKVSSYDNYHLGIRILEKLSLIRSGGLASMLSERGMDRIWKYPQYLMYGAGEGGIERFEGLSMYAELHSTLLGLWFCYGLIPFILILYWIFLNTKNVRYPVWAGIYGALLAESFFLVNYRQPQFWLVFLLGSMCTANSSRKGMEGKE